MPEGVGQLFSLLATVFGIASIAGFGLMRGRVSSLREELKDEREGRASDRQTIKDLRADLLVAQNDLAALGRVVTAEAHWVAIGEQLEHHHHDATAYWKRSEKTAADTLAAIRALAGDEQP